MAMFLVAPPPLLQSCSSAGSAHVSRVFTIVDAHGGDRFDWQGGQREIELKAGSAHAGVVVTKIEPVDWWGLRKGDMLLAWLTNRCGRFAKCWVTCMRCAARMRRFR
ncbi:MAG: hypothetical protein M3Y93_01740 [Pseudomonadota bacterium]|nr:hypothetical protein [Pseudomonadota bacterium]